LREAALGLRQMSLASANAPQHELRRWISRCRVFASAAWHEGFNFCPLEAMACGVPVVGTEVGGLLDTVVHGDTGVLVPPHRPDLLGAAMRELLDDPARREQLARAGTRRSRRYRWERIAGDTLSVYEQLLDHRGEASTTSVPA
jgi:D-inositol-3-phosphate glycosyltransferase